MPPSSEGQWTGLTQTPGDSRTPGDGRGVFVIHAVLMHTGKVLWFSGHVETADYLTESYVWEPTEPVSTATKQPFPAGTDIFCCHHANLEDGRVITVGGSMAHPNHGRGIKAICIFDPATSTWTKIGEMQEARWYPTLVTLPDGRLVVFSGRKEAGSADLIASTVELLSPPFQGPGYTTTTLAGANKTFPTYPGLHLVPGGKIFHSGTTWRYEGTVTDPIRTFSFRVTGSTTGLWTDENVSPAVRFREEGMSVLLPPAQDGKILLLGGAKANVSTTGSFINHEPGSDLRAAEILDTQTSPPTWTRIGDMAQPRINLNAVLLPDGKVLVLGGHDRYKWDSTSTPSNPAELYDPVLNTWTPAATMSESRTYHSAALLLPDGRVVVAGGVDPTQNDPGLSIALNRKTLEFYQPPYFFNGPRPTITNVSREDGPAEQIAYGGQFIIETPNATDIRKVVLMRPGAMTHHTDTEQRYVPLEFVPAGSNRLRVAVVSDPSVAPPGYYMLWIVDSSNRPCDRARFIRLTRQQCYIITDRSTFSKDEVASAATPATVFENSFYVVMDGFLPVELGVTTPTPTPDQLNAIAPSITFQRPDSSLSSTMSATVQQLLLEDAALPVGVRQRFTFKYAVNIAGVAEFFQVDGTTPIEVQEFKIRATKDVYSCQAPIKLTHQPNPYMLDGEIPWLSVDLRVFKINQGDTLFGQPPVGDDATDNATAAINFIQGVLSRFNSSPTLGEAEFRTISLDPNVSQLDLLESRDGRRAFNFAIAQVRYRGRALEATDVGVFFRLFTTAATGMEYRDTTYATQMNPDGKPIPILGLQGGEIATIPFFAEKRVNPTLQSMTEQRDTTNRRTISATPSGEETTAYFGCWLDFNQTTLRFPNYPGSLGPYTTGLRSIQQLIRGRHQCLVAELQFASDPIPVGATPGNNDNLSQRNLAILESDNPGSVATHTVQHTFEIKPSTRRGVVQPAVPFAAVPVETDTSKLAQTAATFAFVPELLLGTGYDELMIRWNDLPPATQATLYMPDIEAEEILRIAALRIGPTRLEKVDDHTIRCLVGDVTYIPLPSGRTTNIAGLMTLELPSNVKRGQKFTVVVQQVAAATSAIMGSFELVISVSTASLLRAEEERILSVMRYIGESIPVGDRWYPVFERYLKQLAERVRGFGGDPDKITPSPDGTGVPTDQQQPGDQVTSLLCQWIPWVTAVFLALFTVALGLIPNTVTLTLKAISGLGLLIAVLIWQLRCKPQFCQVLPPMVIGASTGMGILSLLVLAGLANLSAIAVLGIVAVNVVILVVIGIAQGCFPFPINEDV